MKILVLVAHPDDEVLGMGGTLKKLSSQKNNIKVVFLATGIFARRSDEYLNNPRYKIDNTWMHQKCSPRYVAGWLISLCPLVIRMFLWLH